MSQELSQECCTYYIWVNGGWLFSIFSFFALLFVHNVLANVRDIAESFWNLKVSPFSFPEKRIKESLQQTPPSVFI